MLREFSAGIRPLRLSSFLSYFQYFRILVDAQTARWIMDSRCMQLWFNLKVISLRVNGRNLKGGSLIQRRMLMIDFSAESNFKGCGISVEITQISRCAKIARTWLCHKFSIFGARRAQNLRFQKRSCLASNPCREILDHNCGEVWPHILVIWFWATTVVSLDHKRGVFLNHTKWTTFCGWSLEPRGVVRVMNHTGWLGTWITRSD